MPRLAQLSSAPKPPAKGPPAPPRPPTQAQAAPGGPAPLPPPSAPTGDKIPDRIVKYIPAETVVFFLGAKNLIEQSKPTPAAGGFWMNLCFVVALVGTFVYLWLRRERGKPWIINTGAATLAFPIWAYALNWSYGWMTAPNQLAAGLFILIYTFLIGLIPPVA